MWREIDELILYKSVIYKFSIRKHYGTYKTFIQSHNGTFSQSLWYIQHKRVNKQKMENLSQGG